MSNQLGSVVAQIRADMSGFNADVAKGVAQANDSFTKLGSSVKWPSLLGSGAAASSLGLVASGGAAATASVTALASAAVGAAVSLASIGVAGALLNKQVQADFSSVGKSLKANLTSLGSSFVAPMERVAGSIQKVANQLTKQLKPAISALAPFFSQFAALAINEVQLLVDAFGPLINAAGPVLKGVLSGLQPLFAGINQTVAILAPVMAQLGTTVFPMLAAAIGPLLPVLGNLLASLGGAGQTVLPALLGTITQIVDGLAPFISQLGQLAADFLPGLLAALTPIIPFILQLADSLLQVAQRVLPALIPVLGELLDQLGGQLGKSLPQLVDSIVSITDGFLKFWDAITPVLPALFDLLDVAIQLAPAIVAVMVATKAWAVVQGILDILLAANPLGLIIIAVGALTAAIIVAWQESSTFRTILADVVNFVSGAAVDAFKFLASSVLDLGQIALAVAKAMAEAWSHLPDWLGGGWANSAAKAIGNLQGDLDGLQSKIDGLHGTNIQISLSVSEVLGASAAAALAQLPTAANANAHKGILVNGVDPALSKLAPTVPHLAPALHAAIKTGGGAASAAKTAATTLSNDLKSALAGVNTDTAAQIKSTWGKVITDLTSTGHKALGIAVGHVSASLQSLAKSRDVVTANLSKATANLKQLTDAASQLNANIRSTVIALGDITGSQGWVTFESITDHLQLALDTTNAFTAAIRKLTAEGLNQDTLSQLAAAGPAQGLAAANALLAGGQAGVTQVNLLANQLHTAAGTLADGTSDAMYKAGISAAQGLVKGLQSQQAAIEKQMSVIADSMVARIKKDLKIKSPSQVMALEVGAQVTAGIAQGMMGGGPALSAASAATTASLTNGVQGAGGDQMLSATFDLGEGVSQVVNTKLRRMQSKANQAAMSGSRVGYVGSY